MSLIHNAIVEMEKKTTPAPAAPFRAVAPTPAPSATSRWLPVAGGFFLVLLLAAAAWWLWLTLRPAPVSVSLPVAQLPAPVAAAPASAALPVAVAESVALPSSAPLGMAPVAPASASAAVAAPVGTAAVASADRTPARPRAAAARPVRERAAPRPVTAPVVVAEEITLERHYALFLDSLKANNLPAASTHLQALQAQLPPESLVRLRAEAWFALRSGDTAQARLRYQAILDRVPGDEGASLNLASIEARADKRELARGLLSDALRANPESEAVREALNRFKAPAVR